jgi:mono/diheme cytochrome c family protein
MNRSIDRLRPRPLVVTAALALALATLFVACGGGGSETPEVSEPAPAASTSVDPAAAEAIYAEQDCAMCHGEDRAGTELAPPLRELETYWDVDKLVRYLEDPLVFQEQEPSFRENREQYDLEMPAYGHVPAEQRRALATWLLAD